MPPCLKNYVHDNSKMLETVRALIHSMCCCVVFLAVCTMLLVTGDDYAACLGLYGLHPDDTCDGGRRIYLNLAGSRSIHYSYGYWRIAPLIKDNPCHSYYFFETEYYSSSMVPYGERFSGNHIFCTGKCLPNRHNTKNQCRFNLAHHLGQSTNVKPI